MSDQSPERTHTLGEWYLSESGGSPGRYRLDLGFGFRIGQAFFNALSPADQNRLRGTLSDPYHRDGNGSVEGAVEFLTRPDVSTPPAPEVRDV